jgi:hypothetical protein
LVHKYVPAKHVKMMDCETAAADRFLPNTPDGIPRHSAGQSSGDLLICQVGQ